MNDSTVVIRDIKAALSASEDEASSKGACLIVVGGDLNGTLFELPKGKTTTVGRDADCTIVLEFSGISRHHFSITITDDDNQDGSISDMGSSNGTFLNNKKLESSTPLNKGDMIKLGNIALKFIPQGDTERLAYDKLNADANTDGMTKCFNKKYFNRKIDIEVKKSKITGKPLCLIFFDLDHFKKLNDNYGHDAGDYVLQELAEVIRKHGIREQDTFARYGGEEFAIILPHTNIKQGFAIAERFRKAVESHQFIYDDQKLPVTASIGIADYRKGVNSGNDLVKRADVAAYKSKEGGRNQTNFYRAE